MTIILRTNDVVENVFDRRTLGKKESITGKSISTLFKSIKTAYELDSNIRCIVVKHYEKKRSNDKLHLESQSAGVPLEEVDCDLGNVVSMKKCYDIAKDIIDDNELILFCEDDYYWDQNAISEIIRFYRQFDKADNGIIINPCAGETIRPELRDKTVVDGSLDAPINSATNRPTWVFSVEKGRNSLKNRLSGYRKTFVLPSSQKGIKIYWEKVSYSTMTFALNKKTLKSCSDIFALLFRPEAKNLNHCVRYGLYNRFPCFAPLYPLAEHVQSDGTISRWYQKCKQNDDVFMASAFIDKKDYLPKPIISMTSLPNRLEHIREVLESINNQTIGPQKTIMYICKDDFNNKIPPILTEMMEIFPWFKVKLINENYKVATKLLPALKDFPNDIIINLDDDIYYDNRLIERLLETYLSNTNSIVTVAARVVLFDSKNGLVTRFKENGGTIKISDKSLTGYQYSFLSGHGTLYPPHIFDNTNVMDFDMMCKMCPTDDELWFWANALIKGVKTTIIGNYSEDEWTIYRYNYSSCLHRINNQSLMMRMLNNLAVYIKDNSEFELFRINDDTYTYTPKSHPIAPKPVPISNNKENTRIRIPNGSRSYLNSLNRFRQYDFSKVH